LSKISVRIKLYSIKLLNKVKIMMSLGGREVLKVVQKASKTAIVDAARATGAAVIVLGGCYLHDRFQAASCYGFFNRRTFRAESIENAYENADKNESSAKAQFSASSRV
jgi:hypothetical protein